MIPAPPNWHAVYQIDGETARRDQYLAAIGAVVAAQSRDHTGDPS